MRSFDELEAGWRASEPPSTSRGTVQLLVARRGKGEHQVLPRAEITVEGGLGGDRWVEGSRPSRRRQITLMNVRAAELVADGQPLHMPGDNVLVDLDLSTAVAPPGTRLRLGGVRLEVTDAPHTGCAKFEARFGAEAMRWVNHKGHAERRLRGIHCRVLEGGTVTVGDPVTVEPPAAD
ncbi:MAG: MOSC domain-containing protein [Myxococcales bacterium]|nr:MOSC domain-containing protein [Myxococcales bacterium]MCB9712448.1 MOSC domain-containing protein [Myxococcales bacterium]